MDASCGCVRCYPSPPAIQYVIMAVRYSTLVWQSRTSHVKYPPGRGQRGIKKMKLPILVPIEASPEGEQCVTVLRESYNRRLLRCLHHYDSSFSKSSTCGQAPSDDHVAKSSKLILEACPSEEMLIRKAGLILLTCPSLARDTKHKGACQLLVKLAAARRLASASHSPHSSILSQATPVTS